jgi:hypothetical protein
MNKLVAAAVLAIFGLLVAILVPLDLWLSTENALLLLLTPAPRLPDLCL